MNSLRVFLLCSLFHKRPCSLNRLQVTAGRPTGLGATLPLALGHWHTTQWNRPNSSTKATSQLNDKKKKNRLTKEEQEVVEKFNGFIGERKLKDWKKLCDTIGLEGEFESIQSCGEVCNILHYVGEFAFREMKTDIKTNEQFFFLFFFLPNRPSKPCTSTSTTSLMPTRLSKPEERQGRSASAPLMSCRSIPSERRRFTRDGWSSGVSRRGRC